MAYTISSRRTAGPLNAFAEELVFNEAGGYTLYNAEGFGGMFDRLGYFRACEIYACGKPNPSFRLVGMTIDQVRAAIAA